MRGGTFAAGIAVLAFLTFGVASVAADVPAPICEGTGADTIYGNGGDDLICGALDGATVDGGDTIYGGTGDDQIIGMLGEDWIDAGNGDDGVVGGNFTGEPGNPGSKPNDGSSPAGA